MTDPALHSGESTPSEKFGELEGQRCYRMLIDKYPEYADESVGYVANRAVRIAEVIDEPGFPIDVEMAANALITALDQEVPALEGVVLKR